jgi:membrane protease subunit HflK
MPWNDNSGGGGPWGSGGGNNNNNNNPWGQGPRRPGGGGGGQGGPGNEPDLEELIRRFQRWLNGLSGKGGSGGTGGSGSGGGKGSGGFIGIAVLVAAVAWLVWPGNFYYIVGTDQAGVVLRFGEYSRTASPGPHPKLPYPVETVLLPGVTTTNEVEVGTVDAESLMITQDENIVDVDFVVQWRVDLGYPEGVRDFLFNVRDPEGTVKAVAESAMREAVGTTELIPIITTGRAELATRARDIIQTTLDSYQSGIQVLEVQLNESSAPAAVIDDFRDVDRARQDATRFQLEAQRDANQVVPEARGDAARLLEEARGYRDQVVAQAEGEAARFNSIYQEYALAPEVTRRRMFLETMERVLGRSELIILDQGGQGSGTVPYLPLDQLGRARGERSQAAGSGQGGN